MLCEVLILGFSSNPPIPSKIGGIALFAALAFVLGSIIQAYASKAVGKPQSFTRTIESAEVVPNLQYTLDDESDGASETADGSDEETETDEDEDTEANPESETATLDGSRGISNRSWYLYPLFGPVTCWFWEPEWGAKLDDAILVNRIWEHLVDTHEIPFETDKYGVLYHLMWSKIDGAQSPSRALRIQALRNFNRGMWIATWLLSLIVGLSLLIDCLYDPGEPIGAAITSRVGLDLGITYARPSYFIHWTPVWSLFLTSFVGIFVFWGLFRSSEEDYIEYLFTDYAVAISESATELRFGQDSVNVSLEHALTTGSEKFEDGSTEEEE